MKMFGHKLFGLVNFFFSCVIVHLAINAQIPKPLRPAVAFRDAVSCAVCVDWCVS